MALWLFQGPGCRGKLGTWARSRGRTAGRIAAMAGAYVIKCLFVPNENGMLSPRAMVTVSLKALERIVHSPGTNRAGVGAGMVGAGVGMLACAAILDGFTVAPSSARGDIAQLKN